MRIYLPPDANCLLSVADHCLRSRNYVNLITLDRPVIFAFHGYPALIHKLTYRRHNHGNMHARGYKEEGTTTTAFDMVVLNNLDRSRLALDAIRRIPRLSDPVEDATARYWTTLQRHKGYIGEHGDDMPEVRDWRWKRSTPSLPRAHASGPSRSAAG